MPNNKISAWLEDEVRLDYADNTNYNQAMAARHCATLLDRLVTAAQWVRAHATFDHTLGIAAEEQEFDTALRAIELESED